MPAARSPLRAIIAYKLVRASAALLAAALLTALALGGRAEELHVAARGLRHHATSAWTILLSDAIAGATAPSRHWLVVLALLFDGAITFVEGWGLHRGWRWAPWLVVGLTAALVPFEVVALARHCAPSRAALLAANVTVAAYLARRATITA